MEETVVIDANSNKGSLGRKIRIICGGVAGVVIFFLMPIKEEFTCVGSVNGGNNKNM